MEALIAILVGYLVAVSVYLMLSRNVVRFMFGLIIVSNAANLLIFSAGRLTYAKPAFVPDGLEAPAGAIANSLPQALILTAIVIGFGLLVFALILAARTYQSLGTVDMDAMRVAEPPEPDALRRDSGAPEAAA